MEIVVNVIAVVLTLAGFVGCFIPVIPGPTMGYLALLLVSFFTAHTISTTMLWILAGVVGSVLVLDYWVQAYGVQKFGGGKKAVYCTIAGLILGLFIPLGFILGPFLGALAGGYLEAEGDHQKALKIATGALVGFFTGVFLKLLVCGFMAYQLVMAFGAQA